MLEGLYTALSGMEAQQTSTDAMTNDIANLDTPGYKAQEVNFHDLLCSSSGQGTGAAASTDPAFTQGTLYDTGRPLDLGIDGDGFLEVRRSDGTRGLTRDGVLELDARGRLTTTTGDPLQPPVTLPAGTDPSKVAIAPDGTVRADGRRVGQITLVTVPAPSQLLALGDGQFAPTAASGPIRKAQGSTVQQGKLEASTASIDELLPATHAFQALSKVVQTEDQMAQIANQLIK